MLMTSMRFCERDISAARTGEEKMPREESAVPAPAAVMD
jgi:hypothetical protein